ncbi:MULTISPECIES: PaaI family thioesterase [Mycobacteriaceae]|uniref:Aromatic compound degradation protein PaaI n=2 Tax=Mycolicibacter TaxID=1073531 RepID=A0AA91IWI4_9MYCO|nr:MULTISPECIES: PaaI family thioesterase [Mycobacteriaceae]OBG34162.1 aromatic compound degradation protein PaaI [Mycolicibacter heraklionensis]OBJ29220.1 aromatic compound degradation protein PaaI [Mycolicibacter heraklionensis]OBK82039.1 aromatic compound degradation protein PaaI [Mycolicibacter heraklionensis]PQM54258.1 PaaI family thioesterase [Mycolicibacter virginiensis]ULP45805.1 PaaI family thioesterase [Mycolicibacter virginiensis]
MDSAEFARLVVANMPFAAALQIEIAELSPQEVRATMPWAPERCTTGGMLHGGALMAFADTAGAVCAVVNLPQGASTSTIESKTNFFRAVRDGVVTAASIPLHVGRTTIVVQTDLTDDNGKLVARVTQTQAVLSPKPQ